MKKKILLLSKIVLVTLCLICCSFVVYAAVTDNIPKTINLQGRYTKSYGDPVTNTSISVYFQIKKTDGSWSDVSGSPFSTTTDAEGLYNLNIPVTFSSDVTNFRVGIDAAPTGEGYPFASSPYAFYSSTATYALCLDPKGEPLKSENFDPSIKYKITVNAADKITVTGESEGLVWATVKDGSGNLVQDWLSPGSIEIGRAKVDKLGGIRLGTSGTALVMKENTSDEVLKINTGAGLLINTSNQLILDTEISNLQYYTTTTELTTLLNNKVDKVEGKGLSTNDYTTAEKTKLEGIAESAQVNILEGVQVNNSDLPITNKKVNVTVPTKLSQLNNDGNFVTDTNYIHTDNNYTTAEKTKLEGIDEDAQVNAIEVIKVNGTEQTITNKTVNISIGTMEYATDGTSIVADSNVLKVVGINSSATTGMSANSIQVWANGNNGQGWYTISKENNYRNANISGADLAEIYQSTEKLVPGDVVSIDTTKDNAIVKTKVAEDTLVAGVISTEPGLLMNQNEKGYKLALVGKVPTKVCNEGGAIKRGDLLVSASIPGYAKKASDNPKAGTVIGKALENLDSQKGTILVLVNLQ